MIVYYITWSSVWASKWVARSPKMMLCWQIMNMAYLCWAVLHCQKYPSHIFYIYSSWQSQEQQSGMIKERCKSWLNLLKQPRKPGFGLNHQVWGMGEVQCGSYFTETQYLLHRFDISLVFICLLSLLSCQSYKCTFVCHQLFLQYI